MRVNELPTGEDDHFGISAHDGAGVEVSIHTEEQDCASTFLTADEARQAAVRLMQAADLADPARVRYEPRW